MSAMETREPEWQVGDDVAWTGEAARFVAMSMERPAMQPVALEGPAALIWQALCEEAGSQQAVAERVAGLAGVPVDVVAHDVAGFLLQLEGLGLVTRG